MQIAQVLAGYTLGGADLLRRAMGKKKAEEMAEQREVFTKGAMANGVAETTATHIFDLMEKFAGYGFNKSHSAAYALISYQTAWLKAHFTGAFMAAVLSADIDNTDKVVTLIDECRALNLIVKPPDINSCEYRFTVSSAADAPPTIHYGLGAIKGVGEGAIMAIKEGLNQSAPVTDLFQFCRRVDLKKLNRRTLESLIRAGAMDNFGAHRASLMATLDRALLSAEQSLRDRVSGQSDLFAEGMAEGVVGKPLEEDIAYVNCPSWSDKVRLTGEKETLGLYLTGHPIEQYENELREIVTDRIANLNPNGKQSIVVAGLIVALRTMNTRRGDRIAFVTIDDRSGRIELAVFSEAFQKYRDLLIKDRMVVVKGEITVDEFNGGIKMSAEFIYDIDKAREQFAKRVLLRLSAPQLDAAFSQRLAEILKPYTAGPCPVCVRYRNAKASATLQFDNSWRIQPTEELLHRLRDLAGSQSVEVLY